MRSLRALPLALCSLLAPAPAANRSGPDGGESAPNLLPSFRPDRTRVYFDEPGDGSIWARGAAYKAGFDASGATFFPLFGRRATRHYPLAFAFEELRAAGSKVDASPAAPPSLEGSVVSYRRGAVTEEYDLRPEGVEQRFVVPSPLPAGELVVRFRVTTDLSYAEGPDGMTFGVPGLGEVRYGEATAIDAAGRKRASPACYEGGAIEVRVPADFVTEDAFPLTIDPILVFVAVDLVALDDLSADIAYDATADRYAVVYEEIAVLGVDHDVFTSSFTGTGAVVVAAGSYQELGPFLAQAPAIANNNLHDMDLVVFEYSTVSGGERNILGRRTTPFGVNVGGPFVIAGGANDQRHPDVGGDPYLLAPPDTLFFVVWAEETAPGFDVDIMGATVDTVPVVGFPVEIDGLAAPVLDRRPRITTSNGLRGRWGVVWERPPDDIMLRSVNFLGAPGAGPVDVNDPDGGDANPNVGGNGGRFLVLWERTMGGGTRDIFGRLASLGAAWAFPGAQLDLTIEEAPAAGAAIFDRDQFDPAVDTDGGKFVYTYTEDEIGNLNVYAGCAHHAGGGVLAWDEGGRIVVDVGGIDEQRAEVASKAGAGGVGGLYGLAWDEEFAAGNHDIRGARYQCGAVGGAFFFYPSSCGGTTAPTLAPSGSTALGGTVAFTLAASAGTPLLWFGLPTAAPLCPPSDCALGASLLFVSPVPSFSAVIPTDPSLIGAVFAVQGAAVLAPGGCPAGMPASIAFTLSETVDLMIG